MALNRTQLQRVFRNNSIDTRVFDALRREENGLVDIQELLSGLAILSTYFFWGGE
jgi:hypothetical protein